MAPAWRVRLRQWALTLAVEFLYLFGYW